jgi:2-iminobutanoate/2-iminopropanoate deaminase
MNNTKTVIRPAKAAPPVGPYNHAVKAGNLLFCSGQIPIDPANPTAPFPDEIQAQTTCVLENIRAILEDQALTFDHVIKATVFMTNLADFTRMNEIYSRYFTADFPARSTIQVAALPRGAAIEIEIVALYPA